MSCAKCAELERTLEELDEASKAVELELDKELRQAKDRLAKETQARARLQRDLDKLKVKPRQRGMSCCAHVHVDKARN